MFHVQLGNCTFLGAIDAWIALGASEDATARAAARALDSLVWRVVHAASRSKSLAAGAVVAAVARGAASAPVLQLANTGVARALAPAVAVEAPSSTFGLEAASPTPEVVMADASASTSGGAALEDVAPAPAAADGSESDDEETLEVMRARVQLRQDESSSDDESDGADPHSFQAIASDAEDVEEALDAVESEELAVSASHLAIVEQWLAAEVTDPETFHAGLKAACAVNTAVNTVWFARSQRNLGYPDGYTLRAIFDTEDPSIINELSREDFLARVNDMKRALDLPLTRITPKPNKSEVAENRAAEDAARDAELEHLLAQRSQLTEEEQRRLGTIRQTQKLQAEREANDGKAPTFQLHAGCSVAFPKKDLPVYLFRHLTAHNPGTNQQEPKPVRYASVYCPSKTACTACQDWVQELAVGNASVGLPGAGWAHKRDAVLKVAREVRAAFPDITFGDVDLHVAGPSKRGPTAAPVRSSKRARKPPKSRDV